MHILVTTHDGFISMLTNNEKRIGPKRSSFTSTNIDFKKDCNTQNILQ